MILLLTRVTVLLLTALTCDTSLLYDSLTLLENCQVNLTAECVKTSLDYIMNCTPNELSEDTVKLYLITIMNVTTRVMNDAPDQNNLISVGQAVLNVTKKLVSTLVKKQNSYIDFMDIENLEVKGLMMVRPTSFSYFILELTDVSLEINPQTLPKFKDGSVAVDFMNYINVADILKPSFFDTVTNTKETTVMSNVLSATLPKITNTDLTNPVNFRLKHITELDPEAFLSCMDWETNTWGTCSLKHTCRTSTVCSCNRLTTFALISQIGPCRVNLTGQCAMDFLNQIQYNIAHHLPHETVERYFITIMNLTTQVITTQYKQNSYGNALMNVTEKLASALVKETDTYRSTNITLPTLEIQVFMVGPNVNLTKTPTLTTSNATMDINLIGISQDNEENMMSAAVAFVSYTNMADILEPKFNTFTDTNKTTMSTVVSATLPKTINTELTEPVNFTLKHIKELAPEYILTCMDWNENTWNAKHCKITETNSSHTVCSCNNLTAVTLIMQTDPCMGYFIGPCAKNFLYQIPVNIPEELPEEIVKNFLNIIMNLTTSVALNVSDQKSLASYGDVVLNVTEQLVSTLMRKRDPDRNISLSLQNIEVQVFVMVSANGPLSETTRLSTRDTSMDIDLFEISENNGSYAIALLSYTSMTDILKPILFKTNTSTNKTMMSTVVSISLPKTVTTTLTNLVNLTFKHTNEFDPEGILSCVNWNTDTWLEDGCSIMQSNRTHTVCSCGHLSTFALIMQTDPCRSDRLMNTLIAVAITVGLVFLSLCILTFTLYSRNPVTNAALINLCLNLFLFHLLSLIKTLFLAYIHPLQMRVVLAGVQWFLLMSVFVWMFIEAVLLYIFVKNRSTIRSNQAEVLSWKWLIVIGYLIPLGVLGLSSVRFPKDYIDEECWLNGKGTVIFIFAGPVLLTVTLNLVPYLIILIIMIFTLERLKNEILQMSNKFQKNLIICVLLRSLTQFIILICYWILLYIPSNNGVLYHAFQLLNSQQGTIIFLVHCLPNQEIRQKYRKVLCALCLSNNPVTTSVGVRGQDEDRQDN